MKTLVCLIALSLTLVGCSNAPSVWDAKNIVEQRIADRGNGKIALTSFKKTDGISQEIMGMKCYTMKYFAEITFTEKCNWKGDFAASDYIAPNAMSPFFAAVNGSAVEKGERRVINGTFEFVKTEKGWKLQ